MCAGATLAVYTWLAFSYTETGYGCGEEDALRRRGCSPEPWEGAAAAVGLVPAAHVGGVSVELSTPEAYLPRAPRGLTSALALEPGSEQLASLASGPH